MDTTVNTSGREIHLGTPEYFVVVHSAASRPAASRQGNDKDGRPTFREALTGTTV